MTSEVNILEIEVNKSLGGEKGQYEEWAASSSRATGVIYDSGHDSPSHFSLTCENELA